MASTDQAADEIAERAPVRSPSPVPAPAPTRAPPLRRDRAAGRGLRASIANALEHRRLFVLIPFAVIAGLIASLATPSAPDAAALGVVAAVLALALWLARGSLPMLRLVTLAAAFWAGFALLAIHGGLFGTPMLRIPAYGEYTMHVDEVLSAGDDGQRVLVSAIAPAAGGRALPIRRARLVLPQAPQVMAGDTISARVRFYAVPGPVLPNGYDPQFSGYFDGIGAYGTVPGAVAIAAPGGAAAPARIVATVRNAIAARIDAALPQPSAGIARAIITGDQSEVTDEAREVMATAGIAHVLSVSGLHLTLVAGGFFAALRLLLSLSEGLTRRLPTKRIAAAGGIVAAVLYFAISGGNVAAVRATIIIVLVFGAVIVGRRALTMRNVAIAALFVLATDPAGVFMPSFQLSFSAVVALIGAWELGRRETSRDRGPVSRVGGYFLGLAATSLVAGAATLLFSAYHFQQTSPLGVLGNLLSLPLVGFVMMPAAIVGLLAMPFGVEGPFLSAMGWSIDGMLWFATQVAGWSRSIDASPLLTPLALVIGLVALGWFAFLPDRWRLLGPAVALPAVMLFGLDRPPDVLVADTTRAVAMRTAEGLRLVDGRPGSFAVRVWEETFAETIGKAEADDVSCDKLGCIAKSPTGFSVALVADPSAFFEDCGNVDLVVARRDAPSGCAAPVVIDAGTLARGGSQWLAWDPGSRRFTVRPAIADPNRPWRIGGRSR